LKAVREWERCSNPLILVKGSRDPSVRNQRHFCILIST